MKATARRRAEGHERVLAIGAHPDDVEIGRRRNPLRHADSGDDVSILTMTAASMGALPGSARSNPSRRPA